MSYVIYEKSTTYIFYADRKRWYNATYETMAAAKAAMTRSIKKGTIKNPDEYAIADKAEFHNSIEKKVVKKNLISGEEMEPMGVNTPGCIDPSTETYWSM